MAALLEQVLAILICPVPECRAKLELRGEELVCSVCGRGYRIEERWPVLIPEEARPPQERAG